MRKFNIAVLGATGNVGRTTLDILAERNFPVREIHAIASSRSFGKKVSFGDEVLDIQDLAKFNFKGIDIAFFAAGSKVSKQYAPIAAKHAVVIDKTSYFRMDAEIPLIVPEVNPEQIANYINKNIIAMPNCVAIPIAVALKPLHDVCRIKRIVITTFQSVSGAGAKAMDELFLQTKGKYMNADFPAVNFSKQIAFNVIPQIGHIDDNGYSAEEIKIVAELQKILAPGINITATCVRVPVFVGHSMSVNVEFEAPLDEDEARNILDEAEGVLVVDNRKEQSSITPIDCVGDEAVFVSRIRNDNTINNGLNLWIVSDNLRKGAALNAVQVTEKLIENYL